MDPDHNSFAAPVDGLDRDSLGLAASFGYRLGESTELTLECSWTGAVKPRPIRAWSACG
jgi:hypothetical protein